MSDSTIKSARRVFEVLEYFDLVRSPLLLKQICDRHGYPPSSGTALLKSMVTLGYLEYDKRSRTYLPTMRIATLGSWVATDLFGSTNIIGLMEDLREETRQTVMLAAQSDLHAQYVHVIHSRKELNHTLAPGTLRPLAKSGFGRLLLSRHSDRSIRAIVRRIDASRDAGEDKVDVEDLIKDINAVRHTGYAMTHDLIAQGAGIIGLLLPEAKFGRIFAVGLAGPSEWILAGQQKHLALLRDSAAKFSKVPS